MWSDIPRSAGRTAFGANPAVYDAARPGYPAAIYGVLERRCGLGPGARVFEIGAGTGIATRELLRRGPRELVVVEPDARLARYLARRLGPRRGAVTIRVEPFESVDLPRESFDLGVCATAFHWLEEGPALRKVARLLRPGGWWAAFWNVYGDPEHPSEFHRAIDPAYRAFVHPSQRTSKRPGSLDRAARERAIERTGGFARLSSMVVRWSLTLDASRLTSLYSTYGPIATLPARSRRQFLKEVTRVAEEQFGSNVTIRVLTPLYTAQRLRGERGRTAGERPTRRRATT